MKRAFSFLLVLLWVSSATDARAYIPNAIQLLENMAARRAKLRLNDLTAQLTAELSGVDSPVEERIYIKTPERLRLVQERPDETRIYIEREGKRAGGPEDALKLLKGPSTEMLSTLLMTRGESNGDRAGRLMSLLKSAGVKVEDVTLGIYGDDVRQTAYIIGAKAWEEEKAQLWIDRETFQPVRWVMYAQEDGKRARYENRFTGYGSPAGGAWFPEVIETYRNGTLLRRSQLNEVRTNESLPESLFALP
ncbi:MAG: hypothetical protein AAF658_03005 [Myxococcota bacterium]